jgi:hypothetical protein
MGSEGFVLSDLALFFYLVLLVFTWSCSFLLGLACFSLILLIFLLVLLVFTWSLSFLLLICLPGP